MADYGGQDTNGRSLRTDQVNRINEYGPTPGRLRPRPTRPRSRRPIASRSDLAMKLVVEGAKTDPRRWCRRWAAPRKADGAADLRRPKLIPAAPPTGPFAPAPGAVPAGAGSGAGSNAGSGAGSAMDLPAAPMVPPAQELDPRRSVVRAARQPATPATRPIHRVRYPARSPMASSSIIAFAGSLGALVLCRQDRRGRIPTTRRPPTISRHHRRRFRAGGVTVDERVGARLPLDARFRTQDGTPVTARRGDARRSAGDPDVQLFRLSDAVQPAAQWPHRSAAQGRRARRAVRSERRPHGATRCSGSARSSAS